ncbi:MAG: T9SS type A sorting domain-containing protein, partial [Bacteroidia bacterium]
NTGCALVLQTSSEYALGYSDNGNAIADFNGDGSMDIFCLARNHFSTLYRNYLTPVIAPALPQITAAPAVIACEGSDAVLAATTAGPETIEWYAGPTGGSALTSGANYTVNAAVGNYTYYADAVNSNGCYTAARTPVSLTVNPVPVISAVSGNLNACGDTSGLFGVVSAGTNTYQWYYANSAFPFDSAMVSGAYGEINFTTDTMTIQQLITNGYGGYFVYAGVMNQFNCVSYSVNDTIWTNSLPVVGVTASATTVCAGTGITLSGTGATMYSWSDGVTDNASFVPGATHTYTVTGTDVNGCLDMETVAITVNSLPSVVTSVNGIIITAAENSAGYQWLDCNNSNAMIAGESNQSFTPSANGSYAVEVTLNGCADTSACVAITTVGINSLAQNTGLRVYPNPANDQVSIDCAPNSSISIVNLLGQNVIELVTRDRSTKIDISQLTPGIYLVKIKADTGSNTARLIIE